MLEAFDAGAARWGNCGLDVETLARHIKEVGASEEALAIYGTDIFLACACTKANAEALLHFEESFISVLPAQLGRFRLSQSELDELVQEVRINLLTGSPPPIASYRAAGPLGGWLRISAIRLAVKLKQTRGAQAALTGAEEEDFGILRASSAILKPIVRGQNLEIFRSALTEALVQLEPREKTLLRMHFIDQQSIDSIATIYGVHRATAARWLVTLRQKVLEKTQLRLATAQGPASSRQWRSLFSDLRSEIDISLSRILR